MAGKTLLTSPNPTIVITPTPGPSESARIECTGCPSTLVVRGFPHAVVRRLVGYVQAVHQCERS